MSDNGQQRSSEDAELNHCMRTAEVRCLYEPPIVRDESQTWMEVVWRD